MSDGRNFDPELGLTEGEAASLHIKNPSREYPLRPVPLEHVLPSESAGAKPQPTYHGLPLLKESVWRAWIPSYFYLGGVAGAAAVLGAAAQLSGRRSLEPLSKRCHALGTVGVILGSGCLVADLGRPSRFLMMLRVFRPTSPLNLGTWTLSAAGAALGGALLFSRKSGVLGALGRAASVAAGIVGLPLTGYTAVVLTNSAVPAWRGARRSLPPLFVASGASAAASMLELLPPINDRTERAVRVFGVAGKMAELACMVAVEREVGRSPEALLPFRRGRSGFLWRAAQLCTLGSLVSAAAYGSTRRGRLASGLFGTAGAIALRFAVTLAGRASARNPRAVSDQQRRGVERSLRAPLGAR